MQILGELSIGGIVSRLAAVLLYATLQGAILAALAWSLNDRRPQHDGRLTLNPFVHITAWGAAMAALFGVSWIRSIWYEPRSNRLGRWGVILVVVVGLALILAVIPAVDLARRAALLLPPTGASAALLVLAQLQAIILSSTLLNVLPIPGLIGGGMLQAIWPDAERRLRRAEPIFIGLVIVAIVVFGFPDPAKLLAGMTQLFAR
ncbi:zinc metalloprotease [Devosia rhizoryzae]|uniref:Peptidase M50 domain-containing protein n=1 Tax=Devosia rhizoryzae TaxID=2774137 RepID=A0ABX7C6C5_9HYPH|nr:hypothetical protein [Devosia rhizoryzae]QQR39651.1 hypothetical protein JI748_01120 [Devosia rhizoryzae]